MNDLQPVAEYVSANVEDYFEKVTYALGRMDRFRCPLYLADRALYIEIMDAVDDYCQDNDLDPDEIDIEEIIFQ